MNPEPDNTKRPKPVRCSAWLDRVESEVKQFILDHPDLMCCRSIPSERLPTSMLLTYSSQPFSPSDYLQSASPPSEAPPLTSQDRVCANMPASKLMPPGRLSSQTGERDVQSKPRRDSVGHSLAYKRKRSNDPSSATGLGGNDPTTETKSQ